MPDQEQTIIYTHRLIKEPNKMLALKCLRSRVVSRNQNDVLFLYCSPCKKFIEVKGVEFIQPEQL